MTDAQHRRLLPPIARLGARVASLTAMVLLALLPLGCGRSVTAVPSYTASDFSSATAPLRDDEEVRMFTSPAGGAALSPSSQRTAEILDVLNLVP